MAATVITIAVEKGGCGKTVTTSNLAYLMGDEGKKVLCLDTDPQGNLTFALTGGNAITSKAFANRSLYDMIDGFRYNTQTRDFIVESEYENVDLIPANDQTPRLSKRLEDLYTDAQRDYDRGDPKYLASDTDVLDYFLRLAFPKSNAWLAGHANKLLRHVDPDDIPTDVKWPIIGLWGGCAVGMVAMLTLWILLMTVGGR